MPDDRLALREDAVTFREVQGEIMALDLRTSRYLAVNATAVPLWQLLSQGTTAPALVDVLVAAHEIPRAQAESDVAAFLNDLRARDLLVG